MVTKLSHTEASRLGSITDEERIKGTPCAFTSDEIDVLQGVFSLYDTDKSGRITPKEFEAMLRKILCRDDDFEAMLKVAVKAADEEPGSGGHISFEVFLQAMEQGKQLPPKGPDPRAMQFLRVLEEYRIKCESDGNYLEAERAQGQLEILQAQEEKRQQQVIRASMMKEMLKIQAAHNKQYEEFNKQWNKSMADFDETAQSYVVEMKKNHKEKLVIFQESLQKEMLSKPPKWSRELLEWRKRQHILAGQKNYAEAQKIKAISDALENKERGSMNTSYAGSFAKKEANFRQQQVAEIKALLKRIEVRRKEHLKQRDLDCKRLRQRNRNILAVMESKQSMECQQLFFKDKETNDKRAECN